MLKEFANRNGLFWLFADKTVTCGYDTPQSTVGRRLFVINITLHDIMKSCLCDATILHVKLSRMLLTCASVMHLALRMVFTNLHCVLTYKDSIFPVSYI